MDGRDHAESIHSRNTSNSIISSVDSFADTESMGTAS